MPVLGHLRRVAVNRPHLADLAVAAVVLVVALLSTTARPGGAALLVASVAAGVLMLRRRHPYPVLVVSTVAAEGYLALVLGDNGLLILTAPVVALYTVAEQGYRRRALLIAGALVFVTGALHALGRPAYLLGPENVALVALGGLAVAAGEAARNRRAYLAEVMLRAAAAEGDREAEARRRVTEERLRIARDLHDSVGHHLALINVQAGVAGHVLGDPDAPVRATLDSIRLGSKAALEELRDTVGLLRRPGDEPAPTEPGAGLDALPALLESFRRSGLRVTASTGPRRALPRTVDLTAYRVIQEALTNVCKHARVSEAALSLRYGPSALTVTVRDDGHGAAADGGGHGIAGMRERVAALGGTFSAGPGPGGGWRVTATVPA